MFLSELSPIFQQLVQQPIAFTGGFFSGVLRLDPNEDPLASWLKKQGFTSTSYVSSNNNSDKPQSIEID